MLISNELVNILINRGVISELTEFTAIVSEENANPFECARQVTEKYKKVIRTELEKGSAHEDVGYYFHKSNRLKILFDHAEMALLEIKELEEEVHSYGN